MRGLLSIAAFRRHDDPRWRCLLLLFVTTWTGTNAHAQAAYPQPSSFSFFPARPVWTMVLPSPLANARVAGAGQRIVVAPLSAGGMIAVALESATTLWTSRLDVRGGLVATVDRVFVATVDGVHALSITTGDTQWTVSSPEAVVALAATDGHIVALGESGHLTAWSALDGQLRWSQSLGRPSAPAALLVSGETAYVGLAEGKVVAIRERDGAPLWTSSVDGHPQAFAVNERYLYFGTSQKAFYRLRLSDGRIDWRWRVGASVAFAPSFDEQHVYVVALDNQLRALDVHNGAQRWRRSLPGRPVGSPVVVGTSVVTPCLAAEITGLATRDGQSQGRYALDAEVESSLVVLGQPYARGGDLVALVLTDGSMLGLQRRVEPDLLAVLSEIPGIPLLVTPAPPAPAAK